MYGTNPWVGVGVVWVDKRCGVKPVTPEVLGAGVEEVNGTGEDGAGVVEADIVDVVIEGSSVGDSGEVTGDVVGVSGCEVVGGGVPHTQVHFPSVEGTEVEVSDGVMDTVVVSDGVVDTVVVLVNRWGVKSEVGRLLVVPVVCESVLVMVVNGGVEPEVGGEELEPDGSRVGDDDVGGDEEDGWGVVVEESR